MEKIDYIERQVELHMAERIENANFLQSEGNTALNFLLSGAGISLAYAAHSDSHAISIGALAASLYLFLLAWVAIRKVLDIRDYPAAHNDFKNLNQAEIEIDQLRLYELSNLQERIDGAGAINAERSHWLNRCRYAAAVTPLIALIAWAAAEACR